MTDRLKDAGVPGGVFENLISGVKGFLPVNRSLPITEIVESLMDPIAIATTLSAVDCLAGGGGPGGGVGDVEHGADVLALLFSFMAAAAAWCGLLQPSFSCILGQLPALNFLTRLIGPLLVAS